MIKYFINAYNQKAEVLHNKGLFFFIKNNQGYVLVLVLLVTALLLSISADFLMTFQININYMKKIKYGTQAEQYALSGLELSKFILEADEKGISSFISSNAQNNKNIDNFKDVWAMNFPSFPINEAVIKIQIEDQQGKINLNAISNDYVDKTIYYNIILKFFQNIGKKTDYTDSILDWVDSDKVRSPYGAEDYDYYSTLSSPYSAKNGPFDSITELLLVKNFTPEIFYGLWETTEDKEILVDNNFFKEDLILGSKDEDNTDDNFFEGNSDTLKIGPEKSLSLENYFRVYGNNTDFRNELNKININTAPFRVLSALTDEITADTVTEIIEKRNNNPFNSVNDVTDYITDETIRNNVLTVKSYIFKIIITAEVNSQIITLTALYNRETETLFNISIK